MLCGFPPDVAANQGRVLEHDPERSRRVKVALRSLVASEAGS